MYSTAIITVFLFAIRNVFAQCLTEETAYGVSDNFEHLFKNYTKEFAESALSPDYTDQTDSVAWLINNGTQCPHPLGTLTFPSLHALEKAQAPQPHIPWENINVFWNCDHIFVRWISKQHPQHVQGIAMVETEVNPKNETDFPYLIKLVYSEFNSGAWLVNRGDYNGTSPDPSCPSYVNTTAS